MPIVFRLFGILLIGVTCMLAFSTVLASFSDPPGVDGYYYLKQISCLADGDGYYYKDRSIAFLLPSFFAVLSGDPLGAFRLSIVLVWSALVFLAGMVAYRAAFASGLSERAGVLFAFIAAVVVAGSLTVFELLFEYYKTAVSLLFLIGANITWHCPTSGIKVRRLFSALLLCCALVSHKSAFFFILLFSAVWLLQNRSRRNTLIVTAAGACSLLVFLVFFESGGHYLQALPDSLAPPARWIEWLAYTLRTDLSLSLTLGLALASLVLYIPVRRSFSLPARMFYDMAALLNGIVFIPLFGAGPSVPVYRLALMSPLFSVILLLVSAARSRTRAVAAGLLMVLFLSQIFLDQARLSRHFPAWSSLDNDMMLVVKHVGHQDHLIAHHGLEFYVDYRTGIRARQFLSPNPRKRTFRLAYVPPGRPTGEARTAIDKAKLEQIGEGYALLREEEWSTIIQRYGIPSHWKNPALTRPAYIPDYE